MAQRHDPRFFRPPKGGEMKVARAAHTATLLPSGEVLLVGGETDNGKATLERRFLLTPVGLRREVEFAFGLSLMPVAPVAGC